MKCRTSRYNKVREWLVKLARERLCIMTANRILMRMIFDINSMGSCKLEEDLLNLETNHNHRGDEPCVAKNGKFSGYC
jgi:hypothetical protein